MESFDSFVFSKIRSADCQTKISFFSSVLFGLICHLFVMTGHYPAYSGLNLFINSTWVQITEGRWFSAVLMRLDGIVTLPVFLGALMLIFLSFADVFLTKIFDLKSITSIVLFSGLFVTFPVVASRNYFFYMSECYAAAMFFATVGVWIWKKQENWRNAGASIVCLTLCIASYQADFSIALLLFSYTLALELINGIELRTVLSNLVRAVVYSLAALLLWYIIFKLTLVVFGINSYRDFSLTVDSVLIGVKQAYKAALWFGTETFYSRLAGRIFVAFYLGSFGFLIALFARKIAKTNESIFFRYIRVLLFLLIIVIIPILANYTFIVSPDEYWNYRLFAAHFLFSCIPVLVCEKFLTGESEARDGKCFIQKIERLFRALTGILSTTSIIFL